MTELVTISRENQVADVRLNRPEKYNALSIPMMQAIADVIHELEKDGTIRAVVLSGEGKAFCAGLDVENFAAMADGTAEELSNLTRRYNDTITNLPQFICYGWKQLPMPVIAALHGPVLGGGCQIALGADIRLCRPDAKLSLMEMRWGLIPDMSASQTLRDLVPLDVAKELYFTGRTISGETAARLHLVTRLCADPHGEAMDLALDIAGKSPSAVRAAKALLNSVWHGKDDAKGLLKESELEMTLMGSPNQLEAISANFEKRFPRFQDPE